MSDKTQREREGMANELMGYLRHHGEHDAAELVEEYKERNA